MEIIQSQNAFTTGEMDPKLRARSDIAQYKDGLARALNVTIQPQGGAKRRPGSRYVYTLPSTAASGVRLVPFEFSTTVSYMLCFVDQRMYVFKNGALITNINGSGLDYLAVSTLTSAVIGDMCWTQSYDTLILTQENIAPLKIFRGGTDATWTQAAVTFDFIPKYAFTLTSATQTTTLTPSATSGNITLTAGVATFNAGHVNQYINVFSPNYARVRITGFTSTTVVTGKVEVPFFNTSAVASGGWEIESGYEDAWSVTRGYPRTVAFYQGRLYFGGAKSRPGTVWGSRVGDYFNFDLGDVLDDDAVEASTDVGRFNAIVDIYPGRNLQIFTTGGEFFVPQPTEDPITPATFYLKLQTENGAATGIRVVNIEGGTIFVQRQLRALCEFLFSDVQASYTAAKISLLSSHLLKSPIEMCVRRSTSTDEGDRLLIVNGDDGTIACYTILRSQQVIAPSEWQTSGTYLAVGVDVSDTYVVVKRVINSVDTYMVERLEETLLLDCCVQAAGTGSTVSGLSHLNARTVKVIRDGIVESDKVVSAGSITLDKAATVGWQVGLDFAPMVTTLPVATRTQAGSIRASKKRIFDVYADLYQTQALVIQGREIAFRQFGAAVLDQPLEEYTGLKEVPVLLGYSEDASVTLTQNQPLKMTVLGLEYRVSVA